MAPPRASTRKLTKKPALLDGRVPCVGLIIGSGYSGILRKKNKVSINIGLRKNHLAG